MAGAGPEAEPAAGQHRRPRSTLRRVLRDSGRLCAGHPSTSQDHGRRGRAAARSTGSSEQPPPRRRGLCTPGQETTCRPETAAGAPTRHTVTPTPSGAENNWEVGQRRRGRKQERKGGESGGRLRKPTHEGVTPRESAQSHRRAEAEGLAPGGGGRTRPEQRPRGAGEGGAGRPRHIARVPGALGMGRSQLAREEPGPASGPAARAAPDSSGAPRSPGDAGGRPLGSSGAQSPTQAAVSAEVGANTGGGLCRCAVSLGVASLSPPREPTGGHPPLKQGGGLPLRRGPERRRGH